MHEAERDLVSALSRKLVQYLDLDERSWRFKSQSSYFCILGVYGKAQHDRPTGYRNVLRKSHDSSSTSLHKGRESQYRTFCHNVKYHRVLHHSMVEKEAHAFAGIISSAQRNLPNAAPAFSIADHDHEPQSWRHIQHHRARSRVPPRPLISSGQCPAHASYTLDS